MNRTLLAAAVALAALCAPGQARAYREGITNRSATGCLGIIPSCHNDTMSMRNGAMVAIDGPMTLMAGQRATYTLRVSRTDMGTTAGGGLDVSASAGALRATDPNTRVDNCEVTHRMVIPPAMGTSEVRIPFDFIAPASAQTVTLQAGANAVDGNGSMPGANGQTGDQWGTVRVMVTVTGSSASGGVCPEPADVAPTDASAAPDSSATTDGGSTDAGSSDAAAPTDASATDAAADGGMNRPMPTCACSTPGAGPATSGRWLLAIGAIAGAVAARRRAR